MPLNESIYVLKYVSEYFYFARFLTENENSNSHGYAMQFVCENLIKSIKLEKELLCLLLDIYFVYELVLSKLSAAVSIKYMYHCCQLETWKI